MRLAWMLVVFVTMAPGVARAQSITWCIQDIPPFFINSGEFQGQGTMDRVLALVQQRTPEYHHMTLDMPIARCMEEMRQRPDICHVSLVKTEERQSFAHFSDPVVLFLPHRLVLAPHNRGQFTPFLFDGGFDLEAFLAYRETHRSGPQLVLIRGRSYGRQLDRILAAHEHNPALQYVSSATSPFAMVLSGRVEATIGHPGEAGFKARELGHGGLLQSLSISLRDAEGKTPGAPARLEGMFAYFACSKSPEGEAVIARLNRMLRTEDLRQIYAEEYVRWLDEDARRNFWDMQEPALAGQEGQISTPPAPPASAPAH